MRVPGSSRAVAECWVADDAVDLFVNLKADTQSKSHANAAGSALASSLRGSSYRDQSWRPLGPTEPHRKWGFAVRGLGLWTTGQPQPCGPLPLRPALWKEPGDVSLKMDGRSATPKNRQKGHAHGTGWKTKLASRAKNWGSPHFGSRASPNGVMRGRLTST